MQFTLKSLALIICIAVLMYPRGVDAQDHEDREPTMLDRVQALELDSLHAGIVAYYPSGYESRAQELSLLLKEAIDFFEDSLAVELDFRLALIESSDWGHLRASPYGLPYVGGLGDDAPPVAVLPADGSGSVYESVSLLRSGLSDETMQRIEAGGLSWDESVRKMVDLIGFHEVGHAYADAYGIGRPSKWFSEFVASYFAYAFMHNQRPEMAEVWDVMGHAILEAHTPQHRTLDEFERLYSGVGVPDYGWYQSAFEQRANPLVESQGFAFLRRARAIFPEGTQKMPPEDVLVELEEVAPGFLDWAAIFDR